MIGSSRPRLLLPALGVVTAMTLMSGSAVGQTVPTNESCINCHLLQEEERLFAPARDYDQDIHAERGFSCLDCHGARNERGSAAGTGFLGKPSRANVAAMCGSCHSDGRFMRNYNPSLRVDQVAEYATSEHGILLATRNDPNVAVCVSCHPAHTIRPPSDAQSSVHPLNVVTTCGRCHADAQLMERYDIPTDQVDEYQQSVHWQWISEEGDLSAPTCNDCHGNHGAAPPGLASVHNVCGQCHSFMEELFMASGHDEHFNEQNLPGCATCHGNHRIVMPSDETLVEIDRSVCAECHTESSDFPAMKALVDSLLAAVAQSESTLAAAAILGMEVSQAQFTLEEATTALVKARSAVHSFTADSVRKEVDVGLGIAAAARGRGQDAMDEHLFRRQGLAVSVVLILMFIFGIAMKIRELERAEKGT